MMSAPQLLKDWLHRRGLNQQEGCEELGIRPEEMSMFVNGRRRPSLEKAVKIERLTGIPASSWVSSPRDKRRSAPYSRAQNNAA
jgi:transcriptional regulator with XRE-family HTH domain